MIPMKMGNENMMNPAQSAPVLPELHLGPFPAINQKKPLIRIQQMSGWKSFRCRQSRTASKYSYSE